MTNTVEVNPTPNHRMASGTQASPGIGYIMRKNGSVGSASTRVARGRYQILHAAQSEGNSILPVFMRLADGD